MSKRPTTSISPGKMPTGLSHLVQRRSDEDTIDKRMTVQSLLNGFGEFPLPQTERLLVGFPPEEGEQGCFGMETDDISHRPVFIKTVDLDDVGGKCGFVRRTNHLNLLNLTDFSLDGGSVYLNYQRPGIPLTRFQQCGMIDRIAVATILKKV